MAGQSLEGIPYQINNSPSTDIHLTAEPGDNPLLCYVSGSYVGCPAPESLPTPIAPNVAVPVTTKPPESALAYTGFSPGDLVEVGGGLVLIGAALYARHARHKREGINANQSMTEVLGQ